MCSNFYSVMNVIKNVLNLNLDIKFIIHDI